MAADKICCVLGCSNSREDGVILHKFPNPEKDPTRFMTWVQAVGGNLECLENLYVFKYRRICHIHFESRYWTRSKMLSNIAIPTLHMKGAVVERVPLAEVTNKNYSPKTSYMEEIATASSSCMHETATSSTSNLKVTKSEKTQIRQKITALKKEVKSISALKEIFSKRLKKAIKLSENPTFLKALKKFTSIAAIFTMLQFREYNKNKMGRRFTPDEKVMALHFYKPGPRAYRMLQKAFILPSPFTLNRMVSKANIKPGINENIFQQLKKQACKMKPNNRLCTLIFDEMALTPHFDYNRKNDRVTGLVGSINF